MLSYLYNLQALRRKFHLRYKTSLFLQSCQLCFENMGQMKNNVDNFPKIVTEGCFTII